MHKKFKFGTKIALFEFFWTGICLLKIVIFTISTLLFTKNHFLTIIVNFGIGSVFSKGPGSAFTEGLVTGPGLFYKIYLAHPVLELIVFFFIVNTYFSMKRMFLHWKCLYLETFH